MESPQGSSQAVLDSPVWKEPYRKETLEKNVVFAFTTRGNDIYYGLLHFLIQQTNIFRNMGMTCSVSMWGPGAENLFQNLAKSTCDYVFVCDSDVAPTVDSVVRCIERGKDIVSVPTFMYDGANQDIHLNVHYDNTYRRVKNPKPGGLEKVYATSWAAVLISKRVLEMFVQLGEKFTAWSPLLPESEKELPPDTLFYRKAAAMGFDIWVDWDLEFATHHKFVALNSPTIERYLKARMYGTDDQAETNRAVSTLRRFQTAQLFR